MCGILGQYSRTENIATNLVDFQGALETLEHRGPDNISTLSGTRFFLGHTRLSVIDKSVESNQPFFDSRYSMVYNGEIYNHNELREELEQLGGEFNTLSDTEVLFHSLIHWGSGALEKLNGQFAFAFYDKQNDELLLARDRFGIKPLWYSSTDEVVTFSSEYEAMSKLMASKTLDEKSLNSYFQNTYVSAPDSIMSTCKKLKPGELLIVNKGKIRKEMWYTPQLQKKTTTIDTAASSLKALLDNSVKDRLIADVPLGCFLSGGLDSSIVSFLASKYKTDLHTFSIGYSDNDYLDETAYAEIMAKKIGSNHHSFRLSQDDLLQNLDDMIMALPEPFADSSSLAAFILSKETKKHVTVALSGDGADEIFGGYNKHRALARLLHPGTQEKLVTALSGIWRVAPKSRENYFKNKIRQFDRFSSLSRAKIEEQYIQLTSFTSKEYLNGLMLSIDESRIVEPNFSTEEDILNAILREDQISILPNDMLTKMDSMSMAHSLEVRTPFLDHHVVEYVNSLSSSLKFNKIQGKIVLREAFKNDLPKEILNRSKKGFEIPAEQWLRTALQSQVLDLTQKDRIVEQGIFSWEKVDELNQGFFNSNSSKLTAYIWAMFVFQKWMDAKC